MSLCRTYASLCLESEGPRKRTTSFSYPNQSGPFSANPRPTKVPRLASNMGALHRTESFICLSEGTLSATVSKPSVRDYTKPTVPYHRSLQYYKEQRQRQKAQLNRSVEPITIRIRSDPPRLPTVRHTPPQLSKPVTPSETPSSNVPKPIIKAPSIPTVASTPRQSSPLAPTRSWLPGRPVFPRSKAEPDLYRKALTACLKRSPEGQQFLRMTKKFATSVMAATKELERIVAAQTQKEKETQDVVMKDARPLPVLTRSWVVVSGEDWEMVDGTL